MRKVLVILSLSLFLEQSALGQAPGPIQIRPLSDILRNVDTSVIAGIEAAATIQAKDEVFMGEKGPAYKSAPREDNPDRGKISDEQIFEGCFIPASDGTILAMFSDDGCNVFINGDPVLPNFKKPQHLPRLGESLHVLKNPRNSNENFQFKR